MSGLTGTELEFIVFEDTYEEAWESGYRNLTPVNLYNVDYSLRERRASSPCLAHPSRHDRAGMSVESVKASATTANTRSPSFTARSSTSATNTDSTNSGQGDRRQDGYSLTFMAKYDAREGNSCHIHLSLRDELDQAVFSGDGPHGFSPIFQQFLAANWRTRARCRSFSLQRQ